jgi:hypothetical protein
MGFNKGEWSELYSFLYLIENPELKIVDKNFTVLGNNIFKILDLILKNRATYKIINDEIKKVSSIKNETVYSINNIINKKNILLDKILTQGSSNGSFNIDEIQSFIDDFLDGKKIKGASKEKADLIATVQDSIKGNNIELSYNIKSNLGANPTLLNASNHTNFIYKISNINDNIMNQTNQIATRKKGQDGFSTKLLDSYTFLNKNGAIIEYQKVQSTTFKNNLELIDTNLPRIISEMLLLSYSKNIKNVNQLLSFLITDKASKIYYEKKLGDFANAVTFGMRASETWNGTNEVNGGIISVTNNGNVFLLDLIYHQDTVNEYLRENIYLESPSSTRYKMFQVYKEGNEYFLKLNLQIRCK